MPERAFDIVTMQLVNNFLGSVVDEMTRVVVRTSLSPLTRDVYDFQCGLYRADGEMLLEGEGTMIHSTIYQNLIREWVRTNRARTFPGDVIITNDPYAGAAHLPDAFLFRPVFVGDELVAWTAAGGHLRDMGGLTPGSCPHNATEIYQEGLRIPPLKLYERGQPNETLFAMIRAAVRVPEIVVADLGAFHGACVIGEGRFLELVGEHGLATLDHYLDALLDYAERLTRAEIAAMPDGSYRFADQLDDDGIDPSRPVPIELQITVAGDQITYDFTGTAPQVKGGMNNPLGTAQAGVMTALRMMISPDIPRNGGTLRPVTMILPEGSLLNPGPPAPVASRGGTIQRQGDSMIGCQIPIRPEKLIACCSGTDTLINFGGQDREGRPFVLMETHWGGWGGRCDGDGLDFITPPMLNHANTPIEINEELFSDFVYAEYGYVPDTEGPGRFRGSMAVVREWRYLGEGEVVMQLRVDRRRTGPYGVMGGGAGAPLEATINPGRAGERHVGKITTTLGRGESIRVQAAGGGGWGEAWSREPALVARDVANGLVSPERARSIYRVALDPATLEVDPEETRRLRGDEPS